MSLRIDFTSDTYIGQVPLEVQFTLTDLEDTSTSWSWDFGDGGLSSLQNPSHTYSAVGRFIVSVTSSNSLDSLTVTKKFIVNTVNIDFSAHPVSGFSPLVVRFVDDTQIPSGFSIAAREWNFGDLSSVSTLTNPEHTYSSSGTFDVSLKITVEKD